MNSLESDARGWLESGATRFAVAAFALGIWCVTNLPWQLDDFDQAKQAFTSYEMVTEGHWLYQRTPDDQGPATKPPLTGWLSAALYTITRSWDVAWRLPSLAAAVATAWLLFRAAGSAYGNVPALIAFSAFSLNLLTPRLATLVRSDMLLALVTFAVGLHIWQQIRNGRSWSARERMSIFGLLTAAMLIKGPIVLGFLLPGVAAYEWLMRGRNVTRAWPGTWPWLAALAVFLLWVLGGVLSVPHFFESVVVREFAGRFGQKMHRAQPVYFYLPHLLHKFAPWSVLMLAFAAARLRRPRELDRSKPSSSTGRNLRSWTGFAGRLRPETLWLVCWIGGAFVLMSAVPSKRVDRIFPIIPPLCLLLAVQTLAMLLDPARRSRGIRWMMIALVAAVIFAGGGSAVRVINGYRDHRDALSIFGREVRALAAANHWRVEAVGSNDEGLPLYLMRPRFLNAEQAIAEWNAGAIDALAVPSDELPRFFARLADVSSPSLQSARRKNLNRPNYVLLTRE